MNTPEVTADNLLTGVVDTLKSDATYKAKVGRGILDGLIGTDRNAIVSEIKGVPAEMVELVTDQLFDMIEAALIKKFTPPPTPAP